jgi:hypothetical protein
LKSPSEIIAEMRVKDDGRQERTSTAGLLKAIIKDAKEFFTGLSTGLGDKLSKNKFDVEVKNQIELPEVFKVDGEVSVKDTKAILTGLNEVIRSVNATQKYYQEQTKQLSANLKPEKTDFSKLEKAVKEIEIPKPLEVVSVDNLIDYTRKLDEIKKEICKLKLDPTIQVSPAKVVIDLDGVKSLLETIVESLGDKEEEMTGLVFKKDSLGNVTDIIEKYPSGDVVSSGWNLGIIKVKDERSS